MSFPFIEPLEAKFAEELNARKNIINISNLSAWVTATSNLGDGKTLGTETYQSFNQSYSTSGKWGVRPNPIITNFSIDFSARGTLRRGTLSIKCFTPDQLEEMMKYFMEPGTSIFIQWGWNRTVRTQQKVGAINVTGKDPSEKFNLIKDFYRDSGRLNDRRISTEYCYDNMLGIITGGDANINNDTFELQCKISSLGEIMMGVNREDPDKSNETKPIVIDYSWHVGGTLREWVHGDPKRNWVAFFSKLPDQYKNKNIQSWGESHHVVSDFNDSRDLYRNGYINWLTDFINFDETLLEEATGETTENFGPNQPVEMFGKEFTPDGNSPVSRHQYIKFSALILLLNETLKDKTGTFFYTIDISDAYCSCFPTIFSPDERIFIPNIAAYNFISNRQYWIDSPTTNDANAQKYSGETIDISIANVSFPRKEPLSITTSDLVTVKLEPDKYGWIGDIYVEWELAKSVLINTHESTKDVLDRLLDNISAATDNYWSFQTVVDEEETRPKLRITEYSILNEKSTNIPQFYLYGTNSIFLNANFSIDIPKAMASKIVMSAAAYKTNVANASNGFPSFGSKFSAEQSIANTDAGIQSLFNSKGETDKVLPMLIKYKDSELNSNTNNTNKTEKLDQNDIDAKAWNDIINNVKIVVDPSTPKGQGQRGIGNDNVDAWGLPIIYLNKTEFTKEATRFAAKQSNTTTKQVSRSLPLPVKVEFTVLGTSGFKFGQLFKVLGLPSQYGVVTKGAFMVQEVKHKVEGSQWITEVSAVYRPYQV